MTGLEWLREHGVSGGQLVGLVVADTGAYGLAVDGDRAHFPPGDVNESVGAIEAHLEPRWVWWDRTTADVLVANGVHIARCWDLLAIHRLQHGGWWASIAEMWIAREALNPDLAPSMGQMGLLEALNDEGDDADDPVRPDGFLRPEWLAGGWHANPMRLAGWAALALRTAQHQRRELDIDGAVSAIARSSESAAELLCAELAHEGLPFDVPTATGIIEHAAGPRPDSPAEEERQRAARDAAVLELAPDGPRIDLRNPADVKAMLRRIELDLPDTRAWRLEQHVDHHPLVPALLKWRKAERLSNTYGYRWLDEHVSGRRLRGQWHASDGAAGRMTASAGLHNLPAELRPAVAADDGFVFVRADLGQIEPRVLAAVSGDDALVAATRGADLYQPIAERLRVTRDIAKVAVLGAMYGSTTGESANALRGLDREYPTAMGYLQAAADAGYRGHSVHTHGGRPVHMWDDDSADGNIERARRVAAARGRFARNAVIQGSAAEFFKTWAVLARAHGRAIGARVVLCLHDELLVHVPAARADEAAALVDDALQETAYRWSPDDRVRFVTDTAIVTRWSDAK